MKLNETPVRTSRNFNINNIKLEDDVIPKSIEEFKNAEILCDSENTIIEENTDKIKLTYGLGETFINQVNEASNKKIKITVNDNETSEVQIKYTFDDKNKSLVDNILLIAGENSKATVIIKYLSNDKVKGFHNGVLSVHAKQGSNVDIIVVNLMNENSNNFVSIENLLDKNSKIKYTLVDFGGEKSITNYYSNLLGESSENVLNTMYLGKGNQLFDLNYIGELRGEKTNIDIEVQGALKDKAQKHFKGTIDFKKGAKKAKGNEDESCMLLSDTAKSLALPMLLCSEEDVEGNHSSSAGKVSEKELFYMMSRGFEYKEAMKLMVRAKFNKILESIKNEELKNEISYEIDKRLD